MLSSLDRVTGCLVAGALADALAAPFEGAAPGARFVEPGRLEVTDDTQMTLATVEGIVEAQRVEPESIAAAFLRWYRARRLRGLGAATTKALSGLEAGGHWALVGASGERAAGNGAAMRIAPLAVVLDPERADERQVLRDVCRITHRNDEAYVGALALVLTIRHELRTGDALDLRAVVEALPDSRLRERMERVEREAWTAERYLEHYPASGYVVDSLPLALLLARDASSFRQIVEEAVAAGGDTDTVASMAAQVFGARRGEPRDGMLERVPELASIRKLARQLHALAGDSLR